MSKYSINRVRLRESNGYLTPEEYYSFLGLSKNKQFCDLKLPCVFAV